MVLMIWVNDFWTLNLIPKWLKHASTGEDYLGFSDLIFPWFLFVMGMSIPLSFENRISKGESMIVMWKHILLRTLALLVMGLFHMNMEMYNHELAILPKSIFVIISTIAFFMIWNRYPKKDSKNKKLYQRVRVVGVLILVAMYFSFTGKDYEGQEIGFQAHWWGILGLIGWVYLIAGSTFLFIKKSLLGALIAFVICLALNMVSSAGVPYNIFSWQSEHWIPGSGGLQALTFGGIIVSLFLIKYRDKENIKRLYITLLCFGSASFFTGLLLRNYFILNKNLGTPTWVLISLSTAIFLYIVLHWVIDIKKISDWYRYFKIAGTATLTCYLIPYVYYSFRTLLGITFPELFITGLAGLIKSFLYSLIVISICWGLKKIKIQLQI